MIEVFREVISDPFIWGVGTLGAIVSLVGYLAIKIRDAEDPFNTDLKDC